MLWKKENGIYKDICINAKCGKGEAEKNYKQVRRGYKPLKKDNAQATLFRNIADKMFETKNHLEMLEMYNGSLQHAEIGTATIGPIYANRSACFFNLKMYSKCLIDIELALAAGCSDSLKMKLQSRKDRCMKFIERNKESAIVEPKLDFEANDRFPCLANVLQIEYNDEFGRMITATDDIPAGKIVLVEKVFMDMYSLENTKICCTCLKFYTNLVPCPKCTDVSFCKGKCEINPLHKIECGMRFNPLEPRNDSHLMNIFRSVVFVINMFPDVKNLIEFVEQSIDGDYMKTIPDQLIDDRAKYRAFLQLWYSNNFMESKEFAIGVYSVYHMLMSVSSIRNKFPSFKLQRFLLNLVGHHLCVIQCNAGGLIPSEDDENSTCPDFIETHTIVTSYINHSCAPNLDLIPVDDCKMCITIRPIKKGEQVFLSYFRNDKSEKTIRNDCRQKFLKLLFNVECECERCCLEFPTPTEHKILRADPLYYRFELFGKASHEYNGKEREKVLSLIENFLNKHGHLNWTKDFQIVAHKYIDVLGYKYRSKTSF